MHTAAAVSRIQQAAAAPSDACTAAAAAI
jgi:hypothetical protein